MLDISKISKEWAKFAILCEIFAKKLLDSDRNWIFEIVENNSVGM